MNAALSQTQPVPQALYMNTRTISAPQTTAINAPPVTPTHPSAPMIVAAPAQPGPQALYVNVNNQMIPVPAAVSTPQPIRSNNQMVNAVSGNIVTTPGTLQLGQNPGNLPINPVVQTALAQQVASIGQPQPHVTNIPQQSPIVTQPFNKDLVYINAFQIRIGTKKFIPAASVQFKEDGVLFTLREHMNAPLLLNARAILQCQANLTTGVFPAFFFFLESSCVKQIRNIFGIQDHEFNHKADNESLNEYSQKEAKSRCIAIYANKLTQVDINAIKGTFALMQQKFNRKESMLKNIDIDHALDIVYGAPVGALSSSTTTSVASTSSITPIVNGTASQRVVVNSNTSTNRSQPTPILSKAVITNGNVLQPRPNSSIATPTSVSVTTLQNSSPTQPAEIPVLIIPQDQIHWEKMKKKLVNGGIYQVQTPDGARKFCIWNGNSLMPCLAQNKEIHLNVSHIRIGNMRMPGVGKSTVISSGENKKVEVRFQWHDKTMAVTIPFTHIIDAQFVHGCINAIFFHLTSGFAQHIKATLILPSTQTTYDYQPKYAEQRPGYGYFVLFLKDFNADQREALLKITYNSQNVEKNIFYETTTHSAITLLESIKRNQKQNRSIVTKYQTSTGVFSPQLLEQLLVDVQRDEDPKTGTKRPHSVLEEEDDDDVIMVQDIEVGIKCPYTQKEMEDPVQNKICHHNYERAGIYEFITVKQAKNATARCPYAGCANQQPLRAIDLIPNVSLKQHILNLKSKKT